MAVAFGFLLSKVTDEPKAVIKKSEQKITVNNEDPEAEKYILKDYKGKLAVFIKGNDKPEIIFQVFTDNLPDIDKFKLSEGICAKNYNELLKLIEDYTS